MPVATTCSIASRAFVAAAAAVATLLTPAVLAQPRPALPPDWSLAVDGAPDSPATVAVADPGDDRDFPFLADEPAGLAVSVGDTSDGYLVRGVPLVESAALGILPAQRGRNLRYGTDVLVGALAHAASELRRLTGTRLWVGNLARRGGGDIPYSVSHNSGRDADIALCYRDHVGRPVEPPELVPLNGEGLARHRDLGFDPARSWIVVRALLGYTPAQVQYLFVSYALEQQLLMHARRTGEPAALVARAAAVLTQPGGAAAHDDHLHLRVFCSRRDVLGGCQNTGLVHPWTALFLLDKEQRIAEVTRLLADPRAEQRRRALERLALLEARTAIEPVTRALGDVRPEVRAAAVRAVAALGGEAQVPALAALFARDDDLAVRVAVVQAAARLGGRAAGELLALAVGQPEIELGQLWPALALAVGLPSRELGVLLPAAGRLADDLLALLPDIPPPYDQMLLARVRLDDALQLCALDAAARAERLEPADAVVALLGDRNPDVRAAAGRAVGMMTNLSYHVDWAAAPADERARGLERWRSALGHSRGAPRDAWLVTGFAAAGYKIRELHQRHVWELVRAIADEDRLSFNAQRVLMRLFDHRPRSLLWPKKEACGYWLRWASAHRERFRLERPPLATVRACQ